MGEDGNDFRYSWNDVDRKRKTEEFSEELKEVINALRFHKDFGNILQSRTAMYEYCFTHEEAGLDENWEDYGFRVDTPKYTYMLRLTPFISGDCLCCCCYERRWLDDHIRKAARGIRFIDSNYRELFRIPDGDTIRIERTDGTHRDKECRYIDDYHVEIQDSWEGIYHICEFAELMERNGSTIIPLRSSLPDKCYCVLPGSDEIIIVKKGETGYYRTVRYSHDREDALNIVAELNESGGVTRAQAEAMLAGSMFGWGCPAADPKNYDANGKPLAPKHRDRGDTR